MAQSSLSPSTASSIALPQVVPAPAWRGPWRGFQQALKVTLADPVLWLLGAAGFLLRGGVFVLLVPLVALPTPVEIRLLIGTGLGSTGFTAGALAVALGIAVFVTVVLMAALYAISWLETWSFNRLLAVPEEAAAGSDRRAAGRVLSIEVGAACVLAIAAMPLLLGGISVAYDELINPSNGSSLYDRIFAGVQGPLLFLAAAIVVVEAVSAVLTRRVLWRAQGIRGPLVGRRWRPLTAALGWLVTAICLAPGLWALGVIWHAVRQGLDGELAPDPLSVAPGIVVLALVWTASLVLAGFASALRGALWAMQERH